MPRVHALRSSRRLPLLLAAIAILASACSGGGASPTAQVAGADLPGWPAMGQANGSGPLPVIASSQLLVGADRFLFTVIDSSNNNPVAAPTLTAALSFYDLDADPGKAVSTATGRFVWGIPNERGFYVANVSFDKPGNWGVEVKTSGKTQTGSEATGSARLRFNVLDKGTTVAVGQKAPSDDTPTLASVGGDVKKLSSDTNPDPDLYRTSIAEALAAHKPFVVVFATPAFCTSRVCGPTLDEVKTIAKQYPDVTFINVEPYQLTWTDGRLQPVLDAQGQLTPAKATTDWGLLQEPWTFVVDRDGVIRASLEAVFAPDELTSAIDAVK